MVNSLKEAGILPASFSEGEGVVRTELLVDVETIVAEEYSKTYLLLEEFREYFPSIMTTREYSDDLLIDNSAVQQPPSAKEFVEHVLQKDSSSDEDLEDEEELVSEEAYKAAISFVENFVHLKAYTFCISM